MVPVTVDGQILRLEIRIYRPPAGGPAPTLVFNQGSTGSGLDPRRFTRPIDQGCDQLRRRLVREPVQHRRQPDPVRARARYPGDMIWLDGEGDPFYSLAHSRRSFSAFEAAGGTGSFHEIEPPPGTDGHRIVTLPRLWTTAVEAYLKRQGLGR